MNGGTGSAAVVVVGMAREETATTIAVNVARSLRIESFLAWWTPALRCQLTIGPVVVELKLFNRSVNVS